MEISASAVVKAAITDAPTTCPRSLSIGAGVATTLLTCNEPVENAHDQHWTDVNNVRITWQDADTLTVPEQPTKSAVKLSPQA